MPKDKRGVPEVELDYGKVEKSLLDRKLQSLGRE